MLMATLHRFTKKTKKYPLKSDVHLQWKLEVDVFFMVCRKGGLWYEHQQIQLRGLS